MAEYEIEQERSHKAHVEVRSKAWSPVEFSAGYEHVRTRRWKERAEELGQNVRRLSGLTDEQIGARLEADEALAEAIEELGAKAVRTPDGALRDALARLIAGGLLDDAKVDEILYLTEVITRMHPFDLRVLVGHVHAIDHEDKLNPKRADPGQASVSRVGRLVNGDLSLVHASCMKMYGLGLLTSLSNDGAFVVYDSRLGGPSDSPLFGGYGIGPLGKRLVRYVDQEMVELANPVE